MGNLNRRISRLEQDNGDTEIRVYLEAEPGILVRRNTAGDVVERVTRDELDARRGPDDRVIRVTAPDET